MPLASNTPCARLWLSGLHSHQPRHPHRGLRAMTPWSHWNCQISFHLCFVYNNSDHRELPLALRPSALAKSLSPGLVSVSRETALNRTGLVVSSPSLTLFCHVWKLGRISATLLRSWFLLSSLSLSFFISNGYCLHALNAFSVSLLKEIKDTRNKVTTCRCVHDITGNQKRTSVWRGNSDPEDLSFLLLVRAVTR